MTGLTEREQLDTMTDRELVAYWNTMQFPGIIVGCQTARHLPLVDGLLTGRGIQHEEGALTVMS